MNLYGFAGSDPVNFSDPFGLCPAFITGRPCSTGLAIAVGFVPILGDAIDIAGAVAGQDLMTGEELGNVDIAVTVVGTLLGSGKLAREGADVAQGAVRRYGSKGLPDHQAKVEELMTRARGEAGPRETVLREKKVSGHYASNRRPDVQIRDANDRTRKIMEAERRPTHKRNRDREAEYDRLGIPHETHSVP
jgi:hypothetical protein